MRCALVHCVARSFLLTRCAVLSAAAARLKHLFDVSDVYEDVARHAETVAVRVHPILTLSQRKRIL